jgi:hypothetical protein
MESLAGVHRGTHSPFPCLGEWAGTLCAVNEVGDLRGNPFDWNGVESLIVYLGGDHSMTD